MSSLSASAPRRETIETGSSRALPRQGVRRHCRFGWGVSLLLHAAMLAMLWPVTQRPGTGAPPAISVAASFGPASAPDSRSVAAPVVTEVAQLNPELVQANLQTMLDQHTGYSPDEQLERLDTASRRLSRLTSGQSVDELVGQFQTWVGYEERALEPAPAARGPFDENTAQLHDVTRHAKPDGSWSYRCVLLDAKGRTLEVDMDEEHGRTAYELMRRVRANPLLEKLYRGIVMPLVDHLKRSELSALPSPAAGSPAPVSEGKKRPAE